MLENILKRTVDYGQFGLPCFTQRIDKVVNKYQTDNSGDVEYKFNNMGWRDSKFFPNDGKFDIIVGCSFIEGVGLKQEQLCATKLQEYTNIPTFNLGMNGTGADYLLWILDLCEGIEDLNNVYALSCYEGRELKVYENRVEIIQGDRGDNEEYKTRYVERICKLNNWSFQRTHNDIVESYPKAYDNQHPNEDFQDMIYEEFLNGKK